MLTCMATVSEEEDPERSSWGIISGEVVGGADLRGDPGVEGDVQLADDDLVSDDDVCGFAAGEVVPEALAAAC